MALRLVEVVLPASEAAFLPDVLTPELRGGPWQQALADDLLSVRMLVDAEASSDLVDAIERRFGSLKGFHLLLLPVTTSLPRPPDDAPVRRFGTVGGGLTREELREGAVDMAEAGRVFYATVVLSTVVAALGLLRDNPAVIIGAMVIAPLLGPIVALALANTLGDTRLTKQSLVSNVTGVVSALVITTALGAVFRHEPFGAEILGRTQVAMTDVLIALAAGSAAALALTTGVSSALVGVMVAVALLPPVAVIGLTLGRGAWPQAGHATLLLLVNLLSVNLAATATFLVQGIRPRRWWEADRARRASVLALSIGAAILAALAVLIWFAER